MAKRVLVVDDDAETRSLVRHILQKEGYDVRELPSANELENAILEFAPELLVCDVMMPGRDGIAVCRHLRADPRTRNLAIILISSKNFDGDKHAALEAGATAYLVTPFRPEDLVRVVHEAVATEVTVQVWGCRGSIPTPEHATGVFGANTTCLHVAVPGHGHLVFDAGTGIRALGNSIVKQSPMRLALLLTHYHWDHIQGLPFFKPFYVPGNEMLVYGPAESSDALIDSVRGQMGGDFFPVSVEAFRSSNRWTGLHEQSFEVFGLTVDTLYALHPGRTLAYRVTIGESSIVFAPDNELLPETVTPELSGEAARFARFASGASLLLHDCQYSAAGYEAHRGWGHSGSTALAEVVARAEVERVLLFHHDPDHSDEAVDAVLQEFCGRLEELGCETESDAAREGLIYLL